MAQRMPLCNQRVLQLALEKAVSLTSDYASGLNQVDGGNRRVYATVEDLLDEIRAEIQAEIQAEVTKAT